MKTMILDIDGMSCEHCVRHVTEALDELNDVHKVAVDLAGNRATVEVDDSFDEAAASAAVDDAGYEVTAVRAAE